MEELERIVAEAQIAGKSEEAIKNIIQAYKAANPFEFEAFLPKKTKLTPESISPGQITDTWIDDQGNPTGFSYPEVKITDKQLDLENQTNNANQKFQDKADGKDVEEKVVSQGEWQALLDATMPVATYADNRKAAYPEIGDQLDMQYHDLLDGTTTWKDAVAAVKAAHPKE